jgi:undecaprenyl diphosphate synthase
MYGGRAEIVAACRRAVEDNLLDLNEETFATLLQEPLDLDLVIRTSGESRLSNFLLWQAAYAELYFEPCFWPDFSSQLLDNALAWFAKRTRRFGR